MCACCDIHEIRPPPLFSPRPPCELPWPRCLSLSSLPPCDTQDPGAAASPCRAALGPAPCPRPFCATTTRPLVVLLVAGQTQVYSSNNHAVFPTNQLPSQSAMRPPPLAPQHARRVCPAKAGRRGGKTRILYTPLVLVCPNCLARRKLPSDH